MKFKLRVTLTLLLAFITQLSFAQETIISGTVTDESGLPLTGTTVVIKGVSAGTSTDFDGNYSIKANEGATLVFSFVGYKTQEKKVDKSNTINIVMTQDSQSLDEVVVVAYGTQTRESVVGAVDVLTSETIENQQATSPLRALQGTIAGVNLITSSGQPGTNPDFVIRGFGSFNGANSPLIIVDGAQFSGNLNSISQDQIESISVLKDAGASSVYGSRGANGVVIITTKRGKKNSKTEFTLRSQYGTSSPTVGIHDLASKEEYMKLMWTALKNDNIYSSGQSPTEAATNASEDLISTIGYNPYNVNTPIDTNGNLVNGANLLWNSNWEDSVLRENVPRVNHNFSVSGGSDKSNYNASFDYLSEEGPVIKSDFERITSRVVFDTEVNDWMNTGVTVGYSRSDSKNPDQTQSIGWIYSLNSIYPIYVRDANGNLILDDNGNLIYDLGNGNGRTPGQSVNNTRPSLTGENIMASLLLGSEKRTRSNFMGSTYAEIKFLNNFKFKSTLNYENYLFDSHSFEDDEIGSAAEVKGRVSKDRNLTTTLNAIQALNFCNTFEKHTLSIDAIFEANTITADTFRASATGFLTGQQELGNANITESTSGFRAEQRLASYLGRLSYNFNKKYFFEGSVRQDKTSQFEPEYNTGVFHSLGAAWVITNENFIKSITWLNHLKLRASYGKLGNTNVPGGFFPTSYLFSGANYNGVEISPVEGQPSNLPNGVLPDEALVWETIKTTNYGLDFTVLKGIFTGTVEYFIRKSEDLIQDVSVTPSSGIPTVRANAGVIKNSGVEVTLNSNIINKEHIQWSVGGNFSILKNEILEVSPYTDRLVEGTKLWKPGNSIFEFYIKEWAGVDPGTGDALWFVDVKDTNGNVIGRDVTNNYDFATRYETGKESLPKFQGGFNTSFSYKQFDISVLFNYSLGAYVLDTDYASLVSNLDNPGSSTHADNFNSWSQPGDITNYPRLTLRNNDFNSASTRWLFKNDYLRLKSLAIGYNLPNKVSKSIGLNLFRLYIQGDNLVTWQSHKGIDPEQSFSGLTGFRSPLQKTFTFGALIKL